MAFYNNGIYYPNYFLIFIGVVSVYLASLGWVIYLLSMALFRKKDKIKSYFNNEIGSSKRCIGIWKKKCLVIYHKKKHFIEKSFGPFFLPLHLIFIELSSICVELARFVSTIKAVSVPLNFFKKITSFIEKRIKKDFVLIFLLLLLLIIVTRFSQMLGDSKNSDLIPVENLFFNYPVGNPIGNDFSSGAFTPALKMMNGQNFYYFLANYGPSFTLILVFINKLFLPLGICTPDTCFGFIYRFLLVLDLIGYCIFLLILFKKCQRETRTVMLVFFAIFLSGIPGTMGLITGNIDIFLSLVSGFLLFFALKSVSGKNSSVSCLISFLIGLLSAFLSNSKLNLFTYASVSLFFSKRKKIVILVFVVTFLLFTYLPNKLGAKSSIAEIFKVALVYEKNMTFEVERNIRWDHSFDGLATLATDCIYRKTCNFRPDSTTISVISKFLFVLVFIFPFLTAHFLKKQNIIALFKPMKSSVLFWFIVSTAIFNLVIRFSYDYRLYYSLPIILILLRETKEDSQARLCCYLSMIFLSIKGFWIFYLLIPQGMTLFDPRIMQVFVMLHYYYLIKSGLTIVIEENKRIEYAKH